MVAQLCGTKGADVCYNLPGLGHNYIFLSTVDIDNNVTYGLDYSEKHVFGPKVRTTQSPSKAVLLAFCYHKRMISFETSNVILWNTFCKMRDGCTDLTKLLSWLKIDHFLFGSKHISGKTK